MACFVPSLALPAGGATKPRAPCATKPAVPPSRRYATYTFVAAAHHTYGLPCINPCAARRRRDQSVRMQHTPSSPAGHTSGPWTALRQPLRLHAAARPSRAHLAPPAGGATGACSIHRCRCRASGPCPSVREPLRSQAAARPICAHAVYTFFSCRPHIRPMVFYAPALALRCGGAIKLRAPIAASRWCDARMQHTPSSPPRIRSMSSLRQPFRHQPAA